jgi:hypothetical protein
LVVVVTIYIYVDDDTLGIRCTDVKGNFPAFLNGFDPTNTSHEEIPNIISLFLDLEREFGGEREIGSMGGIQHGGRGEGHGITCGRI